MSLSKRVVDLRTGTVIDVALSPIEVAEVEARAAARLAAVFPDDVKAECSRRILAVANETAQMNMASFSAAGLFSEPERAAYTAALNWVMAMRSACASLIARADPEFMSDAAWPACPPAAAALAAKY